MGRKESFRGMIVVAGTPGTGKSVIGSRLAYRLGCRFTTISWLVLEKGLWSGYDVSRRSFVIDSKKLIDALSELLKASSCLVLDTHWLSFLRKLREKIVVVILLRTKPNILAARLRRRNWPLPKIAENVEAELLGVLAEEALSLYPARVWEIDTTAKTVEKSVEEAFRALYSGSSKCCINWFKELSREELDEIISFTSLYSGQDY